MALNGTSVLVLVNTGTDTTPTYTAVGEQTDLSTENSSNLIDVSSKDDTHTKWLYGKDDDTSTLEALYVPNDAGFTALKDAKATHSTVIIRRSENGTDVEESEVLISKISSEWPDNDSSTISIEFQHNSGWTAVTP